MNTRSLLLSSALALALVPSAYAAEGTAPAEDAHAPAFKAHVLSRVELDQLLKQPEKLLVIDVRRPDEITANGGLPVYLSIQATDLESSVAWIPKNRTIVTLSNHAARAGKAADFLASHGFKVAGAAGAQSYEKDGGTLTKIAAPAPTANASPPAHQP
jgi:rhodanese-related sulfurtransferase